MNHKDRFKWTVKHEQEQKLLINLNNRTVNYFDASKNIKISKDVSKDGLGTVLLQNRCSRLETGSLCLQNYDAI